MLPLATPPVARRGFLARLAAAAGATALLGAPAPLHAVAAAPRAASPDDPDAWIARLTGRDRTLIHANRDLVVALGGANGILRDGERGYGIPARDLAVAVATHGPAIGGLFTDDAWRRFALAERYAPGKGTADNPFLRPQPDLPAEATVPALMERGVVFVVCDVAVRNLARKVAGEGKPWEGTHRELVAGVVPGVFVVPNVFVAIAHGQQRGLSYLRLD